jgi:hypothetical protein
LNDAIANQAITDADVQFFDANGYLAVQNVMPPDELDWPCLVIILASLSMELNLIIHITWAGLFHLQ